MKKLFAPILFCLPISLVAKTQDCYAEEDPSLSPKKMNVVYIMTDDHSYQTISAYGGILAKLAPTPNLDRLAEKGMLFERAFVENSLSAPSRACLMTGLYSHQNGQRQLFGQIDTTKTFFSEILQQHGYQTAVVGKWHLQCEPKGFDYYQVLYGQGEYYNPEFKNKETKGKFVRREGYATQLVTDYAIDFLEHRNSDTPFCLLVHHKAPHRNWMPEPKYLNLYEDVEFPYPDTFDDDYDTRCRPAHEQEMQIDKDMTVVYDLKLNQLKDTAPYREEWNVKGMQWSIDRMKPEERLLWEAAYEKRFVDFKSQQLTEKDLKKWKYQAYMKDYLRCIKSIDDEVGRLVEYLENHNLMENTVIVYTSDQGFYMGEHGWFDKRFMYEESLRTPLIIYYPGMKKGQKCSSLVQNIDYAPTILDIAGVDRPDYMSGKSLIPLLKGNMAEKWRQDIYYHYYDYPAQHKVRRHDGVRDERYKLVHFYDVKNKSYGCNELYDLLKDPHELNNIYDASEYKEIQKRLQGRLDCYRNKLSVDEY